MLAGWLETPGAGAVLTALSEASEVDLVKHGTESDADTIRDTAIAQPLLLAAALLSLHATLVGSGRGAGLQGGAAALGASLAAGHSVGEFAAAVSAGVLAPEDAARLVGIRGRAMARAAAVTPTGMTAVLGGDIADVSAELIRRGLTPANVNGAGQVVAAGTLEQLAELAADPPAGVRLRPLEVAGAFHTTHMAPAVAELAAAAATISTSDALVPFVSNADGAALTSGADIIARLVAQVSAPVRWDSCTETFAAHGITALVELAPGGTLTGLAKRALPGITLVALKSPADIEAVAELAGATA
jgi:[acyl-carrier-protein] S-malonyltransferase